MTRTLQCAGGCFLKVLLSHDSAHFCRKLCRLLLLSIAGVWNRLHLCRPAALASFDDPLENVPHALRAQEKRERQTFTSSLSSTATVEVRLTQKSKLGLQRLRAPKI